MKRIPRLLFLVIVLAMLAYSLLLERHEVRSLASEEVRNVNAAQFVAGLATDDYMLRDDRLYDSRSLVPGWASVKDCKA